VLLSLQIFRWNAGEQVKPHSTTSLEWFESVTACKQPWAQQVQQGIATGGHALTQQAAAVAACHAVCAHQHNISRVGEVGQLSLVIACYSAGA
jgi:hypothetical protein